MAAFVYQVGDGTIDHTYWGAPEIQIFLGFIMIS